MSVLQWMREALFPAPAKGMHVYNQDLQKRTQRISQEEDIRKNKLQRRNTSLITAAEQGDMLLARLRVFQTSFAKNCNVYTFDIWKRKIDQELIRPIIQYAQALHHVNEETNTKTFKNEAMRLVDQLHAAIPSQDITTSISRYSGIFVVVNSQLKQLQKKLRGLSTEIVHTEEKTRKTG